MSIGTVSLREGGWQMRKGDSLKLARIWSTKFTKVHGMSDIVSQFWDEIIALGLSPGGDVRIGRGRDESGGVRCELEQCNQMVAGLW